MKTFMLILLGIVLALVVLFFAVAPRVVDGRFNRVAHAPPYEAPRRRGGSTSGSSSPTSTPTSSCGSGTR